MKGRQMINRDIVRGLTAACLLLTTVSPLTARESTDDLIAQIIADEKTNPARAAKLLEAATVMADQPKLCTTVLQKALDFALKPPATPAACRVAVQALDLLAHAAPKRKDDWTLKRADALRLQYRCTRGAAEKKKAADEFLNGLLAAASVHEKRDDWVSAAAKYREAGPLASYLKAGNADEIRAKLKTASHVATVVQRAKRYADMLKKDPTKTLTRTMLIKTLVVELNAPPKAVGHLNEDVDEAWRTYVPLACKPLDKLAETACKDLGDWYNKSLAKSCSATAEPIMLARAQGYYRQFLTLHSKNDIAAITVKAALIAIEKEAAKADAGFVAGSSIDLLRSVDVARHAVKGTWTMTSGVLGGVGSSSFAKIMLPWIPEGSYELKVVFVRKSGREVTLMFPVGDSATVFCIGMMSYPVLRNSASPSTIKGVSGMGKLVDGKEYTIQVKVVAGKDQAAISIGLNGKLALNWKGDPRQLVPYRGWALSDTRTFGLGAYRTEVDFKQVTLKMTSGRAKKFIAEKAPTKKSPARTSPARTSPARRNLSPRD